MTNLGIVRVARGAAANTTWAALVFLDRVGGGNSAEGHKVVPHVIHVSGVSCLLPLVFSFFFLTDAISRDTII
jgi:ribonuclease P/MRP subunit Rpp14/Pop5-like protein